MSDRRLHDIRYAAERLGLSVESVYLLVKTKQLSYVDVNTFVTTRRPIRTRHRAVLRFTDEDLEAFIARRRVHATPRPGDQPEIPAPAETRKRRRRSGLVTKLPGADRYVQ